MCSLAAAAIGAAGSIMQGASAQSAANAQARAAEQNAELARRQATETIKSAAIDETAARRRVSLMLGAQRAAAGVMGVSADEGSMYDIAMSSESEAERDMAMNRFNAQREAWGYKVQATNFTNQASAARASGRNAFMGGILGGVTTLGTYFAPQVDAYFSKKSGAKGAGITV